MIDPPARKRRRMTTLLTLRELEPLSCLRTTGLLALDGTSVAREETQIAKFAAVSLVNLDERTRHGETQRAGLTRLAAAVHVRFHVEAAERVGRDERLLNCRHQRGAREVITQRPSVDVPLARTGLDEDTAHRFLAAADGMNALRVGHCYFSLLVKVNGFGCCATCGCSAFGYTRSLRRNTCRPRAVFGNMPYTALSITRSGCLAIMVP